MRNSFLAELGRRNRHNLRMLRANPAAEMSGALGDLGTLLPLMMALALQGSIDLPATLVFSGLFNIMTGVLFGIPLPVQPMKAIASSALTLHTPLPVVTASGALVSFAVLILSVTGLMRLLTRVIPRPLIQGIQLGAGLRLIISAATALILPLPWLRPLPDLDTRMLAIFLFLLLFATARLGPRFPFALLVFLLGVVASLFSHPSSSSSSLSTPSHHSDSSHSYQSYTWHKPEFTNPQALSAALAQLPLTTLNSVLAASALATSLYPPHPPPFPPFPTFPSPPPHSSSSSPPAGPGPASTTALGVSVGLMNLLSCGWGAMPVCHGAGGLAAQHRFGARSGASVVLLGAAKFGAGLLLLLGGSGGTAARVLARFPRSVLGVMVLAAGLELAKASYSSSGAVIAEGQGDGEREEGEAEEGWMVMMVTAMGILAFKNDAVGFLAGMACHAAYRVSRWVESRWGVIGSGRQGERRPLLRDGL